MLKRKYRLTAKSKKTFSRSLHSYLFTLRIGKNGLTHNRYGVVVSKKIDKRAVARNNMKRKIRGCIEEMEGSLKKGLDMLFIVKKNFLKENSNPCIVVKETLQKEKLAT